MTALEGLSHTRLQEIGDNNSPDESFERSAALERVYVHEVYENFEDYNIGSSSTLRSSKVVQFLNNLEPGSIICDVGSGNGCYLASLNPSIFAIGVERSSKIAKQAKNNNSIEMALCDNLELPFRDESFDAVLSLSVVHHFATAERRISAIRELARILKVGGKIVISVWAFEQKSRRFDGNSSQDVLIPWQSPQMKNTTASDEEDDDFLAPYHAYNYTEDSIHSNSSRSLGDSSSSISSSSSPNDTCYSFVRRALQKLASGKKSPWFLETWTSRDIHKENSLEIRDEDAKDLPIELRRLDDYEYSSSSVGFKSRSLGSILGAHPPQKQSIVRSISSVPSLGGSNHSENFSGKDSPQIFKDKANNNKRPKLMKQKQSITDEYSIYSCDALKTQLLRKQSSLNEELMAENRIKEKERIRKRIQKQVSLNETFLYRSLLTKRLQVIREGFTAKFKKSTGSLERLTKNGFVKIIKNIKTVKSPSNSAESDFKMISKSESTEPIFSTTTNVVKIHSKDSTDERRYTRRPSESDSSKDSSLQSDTSVESEDSFASVIHNPSCLPSSPLALPIQSPTRKNIQKDSFTFEIVDKKIIDEEKSIASSVEKKCHNIKYIPEIPKFNRKLANFPIVKRLNPSSSSGKNIIVPRLKSLEIFNPEVDDSDSCEDDDIDEDDEDSTPDSIDSVINTNDKKQNFDGLEESDSPSSPPLSAKIQSQKNILSNLTKRQQSYQYQTQNQKINDYILEENENTEDEEDQSNDIEIQKDCFKTYNDLQNTTDTTCLLQDESFDDSDGNPMRKSLLKNIKPNPIRFNSYNNSQENSNSTTASIDSPSIGGGGSAYLFHHIFRQNELDELINTHVGDLHIVSSFYEDTSWCVICEKVQVWTI